MKALDIKLMANQSVVLVIKEKQHKRTSIWKTFYIESQQSVMKWFTK